MVALNTLSPAQGSRKAKRIVGRGAGSGLGKTCGKGHKGQKSRSGGKVRAGFEGGQMPIQMRLPKFGFSSRLATETANVRLSELEKSKSDKITLDTLIKDGVIKKNMKFAKVFLSGKISKAYILKDIKVSKGARIEIEAKGGKIEE